MIIQTFKMQFQCVMWITRHSSIWIAKNSIHCSVPTQLRKLAKSGSWHCPSSSVAMYSVMRDKPDASKVPVERGRVVLYLYATCNFSNLLTLEQWAFEYGLPFFYTHCIRSFLKTGVRIVHKVRRQPRKSRKSWKCWWAGGRGGGGGGDSDTFFLSYSKNLGQFSRHG